MAGNGFKTQIVFLTLAFLLILNLNVVFSDSVDDAYQKMKQIYRDITPANPIPFNVVKVFSTGKNVYYQCETVYKYEEGEIYDTSMYYAYHVAVNGSGVLFFVDELPLVTATILLDNITPDSAWYYREYTFLTMSHPQDKDRYLVFRIEVRPQGKPNIAKSQVTFEWGLVKFDYQTGEWDDSDVDLYWIDLFGYEEIKIREIMVYIIPTFYIINDTGTKYLVFGFAARVKFRAENETALGHATTLGEVAYKMIKLADNKTNYTIAELEQKVKQLYGWSVFIGFGLRYVFGRSMFAYDVTADRAGLGVDITLKYRIHNPTVYSVDIDPFKLNESFVMGALPVLGEKGYRFSSNSTVVSKKTTMALGGAVAVGAALFPALIVRRYNQLGAGVAFIVVASMLLYMMTADIRVVFISVVSLAALFFLTNKGGFDLG